MPLTDVLVVGAGIYGVTAALTLKERGHDVVLVEPGPVPHPDASSTDISKFLRMDYGADDGLTSLMEEAFDGWDTWNTTLADRPLWHRTGLLVLAGSPMTAGGFEHASFQHLGERGHLLERVDQGVLRARFPAWNPDRFPDGYFNPQAGWAESGAVVAALAARARAHGVTVREGLRVLALLQDDRVRGVRTDQGDLEAATVVLAVGAWTPVLLPELARVLEPVGQPVMHFQVADPAAWQPPAFPCFAADTSRTGFYGFPANDQGILKVANHGPGRVLDPRSPRDVDPAWEPRFRHFLRDALPALAEAPVVHSRLCLYCDTFDGDFWIDRHPDRPGLVVATGGSGHGFKFAPVLGDLTAAAVEGRSDPRAERFRWRPHGPRRAEPARHLAH